MDQVKRVRYRVGVIGESQRVLHAATAVTEEMLRTVCRLDLPVGLIEEIDVGGMPCMQCTARASLASVGRVAPEVDR